MGDILIDPRKCVDRRKNKTCICCKKRKCDDIEDEFCQVCWKEMWKTNKP